MVTPPSPTSPLNAVKRHPDYYIKGGDLFFLVGTTNFCVHSFFFTRDSSQFKEELSTTPSAGELPKGSKDSAIQIERASPEEFASFLWTYYNKKYDDYSEATVATWTGILKVAFEYDFPGVKNFAVRGLEGKLEIELADRIALYRKYKADKKYLVPLFLKMIQREEWLSNDEIGIIGNDVTTLICRARERYLKLTSGGTTGTNEENAKKALQAIPNALDIVNPGHGSSTASASDDKGKVSNANGKHLNGNSSGHETLKKDVAAAQLPGFGSMNGFSSHLGGQTQKRGQ